LEVLRGLQGAYGPPVSDREQTHLRPVEELLDHHPTALQSMIKPKLPVGCHHDALASCEAVVLHNIGRAELVECLINLITRHGFPGTSSRYACCGHHLLGEGL